MAMTLAATVPLYVLGCWNQSRVAVRCRHAIIRRLNEGRLWRNAQMAFKKAKPGDKPLTKAKIVENLAEETGLSKKDIGNVLAAQQELAYSQATSGFTIPGVGKLVVVQRKARKGRNPATGESIRIPAKKVLKFRIAKAAKDAISPTVKK